MEARPSFHRRDGRLRLRLGAAQKHLWETVEWGGMEKLQSVLSIGCGKRHFLGHLYIKCIILPRQARDKHRENSKKSGVFLRGADAVAGEYERLRERYTAATSP